MKHVKKMLKKSFFFLIMIFFIQNISFQTSFGAFNSLLRTLPKLSSVSEILLLMSLDDGSVIFSQEAERRTAPASLTKIMTAILVLENCQNLSEIITAKQECLALFYGRDSSNAGIRVGEELSIEDLLYCLLLPSANEAAAILADRVGGNQEDFVKMMNQKALELGCKNTNFVNSHGLDEEGHYTTALDIAKMTRYALSREFPGNSIFEKITSTFTITLSKTNKNSERNLQNTNKMLNKFQKDYYSPEFSGVKTGTTTAAGDCVVARGARGGFHFLAVVMRGQKKVIDEAPYKKNTAFVDAKAMLDWAMTHIRLRKVADKTQAVAEVPVEIARGTDHIQLVPAEDLFSFVPEGIDAGNVLLEPLEIPESVIAPVKKGEKIARARILYAGEVFAEIELVAAESVGRSAVMYLVDLAKSIAHTFIAKALLMVLVLSGGVYLFVGLLQMVQRRGRGKNLRILPKSNKK